MTPPSKNKKKKKKKLQAFMSPSADKPLENRIGFYDPPIRGGLDSMAPVIGGGPASTTAPSYQLPPGDNEGPLRWLNPHVHCIGPELYLPMPHQHWPFVHLVLTSALSSIGIVIRSLLVCSTRRSPVPCSSNCSAVRVLLQMISTRCYMKAKLDGLH